MREQIELCAERLRVAVCVLDALPDYSAGLYPEVRPAVSRHDSWLCLTAARDEQALAKAVLEADRDLRRREGDSTISTSCRPRTRCPL